MLDQYSLGYDPFGLNSGGSLYGLPQPTIPQQQTPQPQVPPIQWHPSLGPLLESLQGMPGLGANTQGLLGNLQSARAAYQPPPSPTTQIGGNSRYGPSVGFDRGLIAPTEDYLNQRAVNKEADIYGREQGIRAEHKTKRANVKAPRYKHSTGEKVAGLLWAIAMLGGADPRFGMSVFENWKQGRDQDDADYVTTEQEKLDAEYQAKLGGLGVEQIKNQGLRDRAKNVGAKESRKEQMSLAQVQTMLKRSMDMDDATFDAELRAKERDAEQKRQEDLIKQRRTGMSPMMKDYLDAIEMGYSDEAARRYAVAQKEGQIGREERADELQPGAKTLQKLTIAGKETANAIAKSKLEFMDDEQGEKRKEWERAEAKAQEAKASGDPKAQQVSFAQRRIILSQELTNIKGRMKEIEDAIKATPALKPSLQAELDALKGRAQNVRNIFTKMTQEATGFNLGQAVKPTRIKGGIIPMAPGIAVPDWATGPIGR